MAQPRRIKTLRDGSRDLISELPREVKDRILECLPTRDAARMALLSTHWNDAWLQHGRLAFDSDFFHSVEQCYEGEEGLNPVNIINNILFFRAGPVKKFTLRLSSDDPRPEESDFKRTIKQLIVEGSFIDLPNFRSNASRPCCNQTSFQCLESRAVLAASRVGKRTLQNSVLYLCRQLSYKILTCIRYGFESQTLSH
nr:F-box/LRR-repeat protein At4g14103-like [Ipomoea trifida]